MTMRWWPLLLLPIAASAAPSARPEDAIASLWRAFSHEAGASADVATLGRLFHADGIVFGSRYRDGAPSLRATRAADFVKSLDRIGDDAFHECEIARDVKVYDRFATVYSVVESRTRKTSATPDFTGVNSIQLYRLGDEWKIVSLYYQVGKDDLPIPLDGGVSGRCLDAG
ncbi:hypothetical protein [Dokdonella sp.]|uniref:hypothetical protein n=1 Tax=Dokdonella sp. TaxID=2291710 RepID=UPI00261D491B|nr:hypothetical protein [Dokdonella sp.]